MKLSLLLGALITLSTLPAFADSLEIDGKVMSCPGYKIQVHPKAIPHSPMGFCYEGPCRNSLIINPAMFDPLPSRVKWFVFNHECGHSRVGASERKSDLWSVDTSFKQGWFDEEALAEICHDFRRDPARGPWPSGRERCGYITKRFEELSRKSGREYRSYRD